MTRMAGTEQQVSQLAPCHHNPNPFNKSALSSPLHGLDSLPKRSIQREFEILSTIGDGACGRVFKARHKTSQILVALKRLHARDESFIKEVAFLRQLRNQDGTIKLYDTFLSEEDNAVFLAFEYMELDLSGLLSLHLPLSYNHIRYLFKGVVEATAACHRESVLHRDLKSSNFLVDHGARVKLGDFGLATYHEPNVPMTSNVVTLWYRAPELLLGSTQYGFGVDTWSLGCILVELMTGKSPFPGRDERHQLELIYHLCGHPDAPSNDPRHRRRLGEVFQIWPREALDLLERFLQLDAAQRISAEDALRHEFFATLTPEAEAIAQAELAAMLRTHQVHEYEVKQQRAARAAHHHQQQQHHHQQAARTVATISASCSGSRKRPREDNVDSASPERPVKRLCGSDPEPVHHTAEQAVDPSSSAYRPRPSDHCVRRSGFVDGSMDGALVATSLLPQSASVPPSSVTA